MKVGTNKGGHQKIHSEQLLTLVEQACTRDIREAFTTIETNSQLLDEPIDQYLPEPRNIRNINRLPHDIKKKWITAIKKEIQN